MDLKECKDGKHKLEKIYAVGFPNGEGDCVRWCAVCGSVVVDGQHDGRVYPGKFMKMRAPEISKAFVCKPKYPEWDPECGH